MIRIDITPVFTVTTVKTNMVKGREVKTEERSRQYSAIARRGDETIAEVTLRETMSVIPPILKMVRDAGADLGEEVMFYRGTTPVFVSMTLDQWLNPPKKERKKKDGGDGSGEARGVLQASATDATGGDGDEVREVGAASRRKGEGSERALGVHGDLLPTVHPGGEHAGDMGGEG